MATTYYPSRPVLKTLTLRERPAAQRQLELPMNDN